MTEPDADKLMAAIRQTVEFTMRKAHGEHSAGEMAFNTFADVYQHLPPAQKASLLGALAGAGAGVAAVAGMMQ